MARMPRGEPRSVPDPDKEGYDAMTRRQGALNPRGASQATAGSRSQAGPAAVATDAIRNGYQYLTAKDANGRPLHPIGHPSLGESVIPVLGAGHEALADFQEGHPVAGALNLGLAGVEATGIGTVGSDVFKVGLRLGRSQTWDALRKVYGKEGLIEKTQPGHHIVARSKFPPGTPDRVVHNWLNIKPMTDGVVDGIKHTGTEIHRRMHTRARLNGEWLPMFTPVQKLVYGTKPSTRVILGAPLETAGRVGFHAATPDDKRK